jgi:hypothetical protein
MMTRIELVALWLAGGWTMFVLVLVTIDLYQGRDVSWPNALVPLLLIVIPWIAYALILITVRHWPRN